MRVARQFSFTVGSNVDIFNLKLKRPFHAHDGDSIWDILNMDIRHMFFVVGVYIAITRAAQFSSVRTPLCYNGNKQI